MELVALVQDIHRLSHEMERFERKYGVMSRTFYDLYSSGEEPENDACVLDFEKWAGLYEVWRDRQKAYNEALERLCRERPTPDIKHHRVPAPHISFVQPNLPTLIQEVSDLVLSPQEGAVKDAEEP